MNKYIDSEAFLKAINALMYKDTTGYLDASTYNGAISDVADVLTHFLAANVVEVSKVRQVLLAEFGKEEEEAVDALMERMK